MNRRLLAKLVRLPRHEWAELLRAQVAVLHAQLLVWTRPRGSLVTPSASSVAPATGETEIEPAAQRLALAVERVAEYGLWRPSCLVRAVALHRALRSRGLAGSSVCVGVRLEHGRFLAHAWVDYRGNVLADEAWHVKTFDELAQMIAGQTA